MTVPMDEFVVVYVCVFTGSGKVKCAERSTSVTSFTNLYIFLRFDMGLRDKKLGTSYMSYGMANI
jgi:hypothetical protein